MQQYLDEREQEMQAPGPLRALRGVTLAAAAAVRRGLAVMLAFFGLSSLAATVQEREGLTAEVPLPVHGARTFCPTCLVNQRCVCVTSEGRGKATRATSTALATQTGTCHRTPHGRNSSRQCPHFAYNCLASSTCR